MTERFTVEVDITAKDKTQAATTSAQKGFRKTFDEVLTGALRTAGASLTGFAAQIPQMVVELGKLGVEAQAMENRFTKFAGGTEQATSYLEAFNRGTDSTVDRMAAMSSAARLLQMGLVSTDDEMESVAAMAVKLGNQTMSAGDRIGDFAALLANQSIPRLDNFGISSGRVRERIDELLKSGQALNREQAFKMAVMEEGAKALATLGDTSDQLATSLDQTRAALKDVRLAAGEAIATAGEASGIFPKAASGMRKWADEARLFTETMQEIKTWGMDWNQFGDTLKRNLWEGTQSAETYLDTVQHFDSATQSYTGMARAAEEMAGRLDHVSYVSDDVKESLHDQVTSQGMLMHTVLQTAAALEQEAQAMDEFVYGMDQAAQMQLSMSFTNQLDRMQESAADFATKREELEAEHQNKLAELQARGATKAIQINATAEQAKLDDLRERYAIALQQQSEFTDKTKESTLMSKERQLADLQDQIARQESMLNAYNEGRLVQAGENVDELIAEEDRRHQAAIAGLDEEMAKQQQIQEQALGNMMLQAFDAWSENKDISVEKMLEMRTAIAEEYGLVGEGATELVTDMVGEWDRWATDTRTTTDEVVGYMADVVTAAGEIDTKLLEMTAKDYVIHLRIEQENLPIQRSADRDGVPGGYQTPGFQHGGQFLVGERGAEIVTIQPIAGNTTYNETVNIGNPHDAAAFEERRRRERQQTFARTM